MRTHFVILLLAALCLSAGVVSAQSSNLFAGTIATSIDASASVYGLPSGNGSISAGEQALGAAAQGSIETFSTQVETFVQSSPANGAAINAIDANVAAGKIDPRAAGISAAVNGEPNPYIDYSAIPNNVDPRAAGISAAVNGEPNPYIDYSAIPNSVDPRAVGVSAAVNGEPNPYVNPPADSGNRPEASSNNPQHISPDALAISNAVAQYGVENATAKGQTSLSAQDQQTLRQSVRDGIDHAVDHSSVPHKSLVKVHLHRLIEREVPAQNLPINGYWRVKPFSMSSSGHCIVDNGDNGGPDGNGTGEILDPGRPLCGYANSPDLPFITWDGEDLPYLPGTGSIYSPAPDVRYDLARDSSGKSTASVKVMTIREYRVVSPSEIHVHLVIQEDGGCTLSADYVLELVTPDDSICVANKPISTPEPTSTPPPDQQGPFHAGIPLFNDEADCDDSNRPPAFGDIYLHAQPGGAMMVDYGSGQQITFAEGWNNYSYDSGNANGGRLSFALTLYDGGGSIFWSKKSDGDNAKMCVGSFDLISPESEAALTSTPPAGQSTDQPGDLAGETGDSSASSFVLPTGHFTVTWAEYPGIACPAPLAPLLPKFPEMTISEAGGVLTAEAGGVGYSLVNQGGNFLYMVFNPDNSGVIMSFNGFDADGNVLGSYMIVGADGTSCMNSLTLKPA